MVRGTSLHAAPHVQNKVEDKFWEEDALQESYIEEFIIRVGDSDEDSNSNSDISGSSEESDD